MGIEARLTRAARYGHHLERLAVLRPATAATVTAETAAVAMATAARATRDTARRSAVATAPIGDQPAAAASSPGGGLTTSLAAAPIQRKKSWRKKLAGAGVVGGGLALLGGLVGGFAAAPLMIGLGGLAMLGGGGYLANQYRNSESRGLQQVRTSSGPRGSNPDPLVHRILNDVAGEENMRGVDISDERSSTPRGDSTREGRERNRHSVRLDPTITDRNKRLSYLAHELTHVSADRHYTMNALEGAQFYNQDQPPGDFEGNMKDYLDQRRTHLSGQLTQTQGLVDNDPHLGQEHRDYFKQRLRYAIDSPMNEHDTVLNELTLYGHLEGLPRNSPTLQSIRNLAGAAHRHRTAIRR